MVGRAVSTNRTIQTGIPFSVSSLSFWNCIRSALRESRSSRTTVVDGSADGTDIESGTLTSNPHGLLYRAHGRIFKQRAQTPVAARHRLPIHLHDIPEAEPLRMIRHPDDPELRFQQYALEDSNTLLVAFDRDSGWQKLGVGAQILMQSLEHRGERDILRRKCLRHQEQQQNGNRAAAHRLDGTAS